MKKGEISDKQKKKRFFDFNKEIISAEIGSLIGAPTASVIAATMTSSITLISASAVGGGIIGGSIMWMTMRLRDHKKEKDYARKKLLKDVLYIVPVNTVTSWLVYQPVLFFLSRYLLNLKFPVIPSVFTAQIIGFGLYLAALDTYREWIEKKFNKEL